MLSDAKKKAYRNMPQAERWREVEALMDFAWRYLRTLPRDEVARRLEVDRRGHDQSDAIIRDHLRSLS